ncbi:MAG: hypothetical protein IKB80_02505 [Oscillospiraceae bacterium]|nr:hypothetical protein [Oscillospiraceae bacterium]
MFVDFTLLAIVSLVLMALWAVLLCLGKKKVFALFAVAHCLLYIDCFVLQNHFNFAIAGIMLAISAVAAVIKLLQHKKIRYSKALAMYLLISAVPVFLYLLVSI